MTTTMPSRAQIDAAEPLEFARPPRLSSERQANITIEGMLDGLTVKVEFTAAVSAIPAAIERLKAIGLASAARTITPVSPKGEKKPKADRLQPKYNDAGEACCPKHNRVLKQGQYGLYCSAKDDTTERGYCSLKFAE